VYRVRRADRIASTNRRTWLISHARVRSFAWGVSATSGCPFFCPFSGADGSKWLHTSPDALRQPPGRTYVGRLDPAADVNYGILQAVSDALVSGQGGFDQWQLEAAYTEVMGHITAGDAAAAVIDGSVSLAFEGDELLFVAKSEAPEGLAPPNVTNSSNVHVGGRRRGARQCQAAASKAMWRRRPRG